MKTHTHAKSAVLLKIPLTERLRSRVFDPRGYTKVCEGSKTSADLRRTERKGVMSFLHMVYFVLSSPQTVWCRYTTAAGGREWYRNELPVLSGILRRRIHLYIPAGNISYRRYLVPTGISRRSHIVFRRYTAAQYDMRQTARYICFANTICGFCRTKGNGRAIRSPAF